MRRVEHKMDNTAWGDRRQWSENPQGPREWEKEEKTLEKVVTKKALSTGLTTFR